MEGEEKTREQLLSALAKLRQQLVEANRRIADLEATEAECRLAEEALKESQAEFSAMFDNAPITLVLVDQERRVRRANRVAAELSSRSVEDMVGLRDGVALRCVYSLDDPEGCGYAPFCAECALRATVLDTFETGRGHHQVEVELPLAREDGLVEKHFLLTTTHVEVSKSRLVLVSIEDITERKRAEESLRESEERYRSVVENSHAGILIVDGEYRFIYVNDQLCRILGRPREEVVDHDFREFLADESRQIVADRYVRRQRGEAVPPRYEVDVVRKSGEKRRVEISASLVQDPAGNVRTMGQLLDITERKQAEEEIARMAKFPSENPNPTLRVARDGTILYANRASSFLLDVWQCQVSELIPNHWHEFALDALSSSLSKEIEIEVKDRILSLTFAPVTEAGYVNVYGLDITERKEAAEALRLYAAELEARNAELDAFAHTVAHDLKNPLGLAIGYAKLLEKECPTLSQEDMDGYLHTIVQNGYKMNTIIDELLLLSEVRKAEVPITSLDMASVVAEAQQRLIHVIEESHAEIVAPERWPQALGYGPWIEGVWANYLDNAIKYGGQPPRIQLGAEVEPNNRVRFWVRDNGPGLSPEEQARLFTPFDRLGQVQAKGHGLGLSIVRRIVEKLGGEVDVKSEVGQGSVFAFTLPASS